MRLLNKKLIDDTVFHEHNLKILKYMHMGKWDKNCIATDSASAAAGHQLATSIFYKKEYCKLYVIYGKQEICCMGWICLLDIGTK